MKLYTIACAAALLWLGGCASTTGLPAGSTASGTPSASTSTTPSIPSAGIAAKAIAAKAPAPPVIPGGPLQPIGSARASSSGVAATAPPAELWDRIRRGFAMPNLDTDLVRSQEQWYSSRPDYIARMTDRSRKYLFHIVEELERRNMPTELALLPFIESAFNPQAVSTAKAAGMWQFMPATGKAFDLRQSAFRDDRRDVLASTRAALDYLQKLYGMFGDWHLALAAYNWGEGSVGRAIAKNQRAGLATGYLDLNMPGETRNYVPKLQAVKNIVANPPAFRAELPLIENHPYFQSVTVTRDIDVALAAKLADVPVEDFRALNPFANRPVILAAGSQQILLPWDNATVFQRNFEAYNQGQYASWTVWTAPSTMNAADAARRVGMSEADFRAINNIPPRMLIKTGSAMLAPRSAKMADDVAVHIAESGQVSLAPEIVTRRTTVKARKGESVASIARRYKLPAADVASWNEVSAKAAFKAGEQVVVFLPVLAAASRRSPASGHAGASSARKLSSHPVKRGGTPSKRHRR
ncbi:MAG: transglycosylase SLT domain-containing protein [Bdellovibrionales bacterium]|nr:transglycosylase SLT domain-containing protein [Ramlibacter sp.]